MKITSNSAFRTFAALMLLLVSAGAMAQTAARFVGTITAIDGNTLSVKTDAGEQKQVQVPSDAVLKRLAPGQRDLSAAPAIAISDLAVGDRVLVKLSADTAGPVPQAAQIVAMKQSDLAQKQQHDREDWQKRGVGGLVKSVDEGAGTIVVSTGAGPTAKTITLHTSQSTTLLRYAPGSVRFADAKPAPISAIKAGDQLRARGDKNADGTDMNAEEIVSGTFRHLSGTISSTDTSANTLTIKDLATKKSVTIHIVPDSQMHKLPERMAQMLAMRLKGTAPAGMPAGMHYGAQQAGAAPGNGQKPNGGMPGFGGNGGSGGDPQQMLNHTPTVQLSELQKGEAVMVVATDGTNDVNAITLLAGVEPLLEAPAASNLLSNWSMGGGGDAAGAQ